MKYVAFCIYLTILFVSCSEDEHYRKLKLTGVVLSYFIDTSNLLKWDTTNGPDMFVTITLNDSTIFISDRFENIDVLSTPVKFSITSDIIFQSVKDEIYLSAFDADLTGDQIMEEYITVQPGISNMSPFSEFISCGKCIGDWYLTYEILE